MIIRKRLNKFAQSNVVRINSKRICIKEPTLEELEFAAKCIQKRFRAHAAYKYSKREKMPKHKLRYYLLPADKNDVARKLQARFRGYMENALEENACVNVVTAVWTVPSKAVQIIVVQMVIAMKVLAFVNQVSLVKIAVN